MSLNPVGNVTDSVYNRYGKASSAKTSTKAEETAKAEEKEAVYEKSKAESKATYSINKMSASDRAALVQQLKQDQENRQQSLISLVHDMMNGQAKSYSLATGDDSIWRFLSSGNFTVDAATKAQAQADIAEDGYWGIAQTSQRLFDFASALAGDDVEKMQKMQQAMEKGFKQATAAWGKSLPEISQKTLEAANKLFEDYYKSKEAE
ncbi:MAG: hypothetical protein UEY91_04665 [Lachnospiraceae bacterium]|nr:hypothetical protein [Pseudobutyrivibrio sp.]MEE0106070.1 hypothetical protein [Lachnospiraceae bacterium]